MADRLMNREPEICRIENEIVPARLDGLGRELLGGNRCPSLRIARQIEQFDVFPPLTTRRELVFVCLEITGRNSGGTEVRADADECLRDVRSLGRDERFYFSQKLEARADEADILHLEGRFVRAKQQRDLFLERDVYRIAPA
jgi:hypothetical protein